MWDFESGTLYKREYAAYLFSQILGWEFVPETVIREGPYGVGSMQRFVEHEPGVTYRELRESHIGQDLKRIACFDIIANNADRKAVHCIKGTGRSGVGHRSRVDIQRGVHAADGDLGLLGRRAGAGDPGGDGGVFYRRFQSRRVWLRSLSELLQPEEMEALAQRTGWLAKAGAFPEMRRF